jgi:hypothetical protein
VEGIVPANVMLLRPVQPKKVLESMLVTLAGMVKLARLTQREKA